MYADVASFSQDKAITIFACLLSIHVESLNPLKIIILFLTRLKIYYNYLILLHYYTTIKL